MNASLSPRESFWEVDDSALSQFTPVKDGDVRSKGRPQLSPTSRQAAERYYKELSEFGDASPVGGQTFAPIGDGFDGNATGGSGGQPAEKQSTISNLQQQLKTFSKKVETGKRELAKLEAEIAQLKDSIQQGTAERGGFRAVQENASVVAKAELIMDKRVAKATVRSHLATSLSKDLFASVVWVRRRCAWPCTTATRSCGKRSTRLVTTVMRS